MGVDVELGEVVCQVLVTRWAGGYRRGGGEGFWAEALALLKLKSPESLTLKFLPFEVHSFGILSDGKIFENASPGRQ